MKSKTTLAAGVLAEMSNAHLVGVLKAAGVKPGKTKAANIDLALAAVEAGRKGALKGALHFKASVTFSTNPAKPGEPTQRVTYYGAVHRTYKSGPGQENSVVITPDNPIPGSPRV